MAIVSSGSLFKYATTVGSGGATFTTFGEVKSISLDGISIAEIDTSSISSTVKSFVGGTKDSGTISLSIYAPAYTAAVLGEAANQGALNPYTYANGANYRNFKIQFGPNTGAGGFELTFGGYVTSFNVSASVDGSIDADISIRVTGAFNANST